MAVWWKVLNTIVQLALCAAVHCSVSFFFWVPLLPRSTSASDREKLPLPTPSLHRSLSVCPTPPFHILLRL